jgi:NADPH:quinone reductase-like Zn-dependent oxidoreductase
MAMHEPPKTKAAETMWAIVYHAYGSPEAVLKLEQVERPAVDRGAALVRVHASSVNLDDLQYVRGEIFVRPGAFSKPRYKILGSDIAGTVEAIGNEVAHLRRGDEVVADLTLENRLLKKSMIADGGDDA